MAIDAARTIEAFYAAKRVIHYYWLHTDSEHLEVDELFLHNIKRIVEIMTCTEISVQEFQHEAKFHRAFIDKYDSDKHTIFVASNDPEEWQRASIIKEICHVLVDKDGEFQSDPCKTIASVLDDIPPFHEHSNNEADSEALAEIIAMEIFYPIEHRREDIGKIENGAEVSDIAKARKVPQKYVVQGIEDTHFKSSEKIWALLPAPEPINLDEYL